MPHKKSVGYPISEDLHYKIKIKVIKGVLWRQLGALFVSMGKKFTKKELDKFRNDYPLAYQFIEELP